MTGLVDWNGVEPYTDEEMALMPEKSCDICGAPVDSFPTDGNEIFWPTDDGGWEQLCYACQWERHDRACVVKDGTCDQQADAYWAQDHRWAA